MLIVFFIIGVLVLGLGGAIWKFNFVEIIAGYEEKRIIDKQGLTKWVGTNLIFMGIVLVFISILGYWFCETVWISVIFVTVVILFSIRIAVGCKRYEKPKE